MNIIIFYVSALKIKLFLFEKIVNKKYKLSVLDSFSFYLIKMTPTILSLATLFLVFFAPYLRVSFSALVSFLLLIFLLLFGFLFWTLVLLVRLLKTFWIYKKHCWQFGEAKTYELSEVKLNSHILQVINYFAND